MTFPPNRLPRWGQVKDDPSVSLTEATQQTSLSSSSHYHRHHRQQRTGSTATTGDNRHRRPAQTQQEQYQRSYPSSLLGVSGHTTSSSGSSLIFSVSGSTSIVSGTTTTTSLDDSTSLLDTTTAATDNSQQPLTALSEAIDDHDDDDDDDTECDSRSSSTPNLEESSIESSSTSSSTTTTTTYTSRDIESGHARSIPTSSDDSIYTSSSSSSSSSVSSSTSGCLSTIQEVDSDLEDQMKRKSTSTGRHSKVATTTVAPAAPESVSSSVSDLASNHKDHNSKSHTTNTKSKSYKTKTNSKGSSKNSGQSLSTRSGEFHTAPTNDNGNGSTWTRFCSIFFNRATSNNRNHQHKDGTSSWDRTWLYAMGLMAGFIGIVAIILAIRDHTQSSHYSYGNSNQWPQSSGDPSSSSTSLLDQKWGDFAGHATISNNYRVLQRFAHDPKSFTQGLQWHNNRLVESTGMNGESQVRVYDPRQGSSLDQAVDVPNDAFGEGLCWFQDANGQDRYIQLTWMEKVAFVYDADNLELVYTFNYTTTTNEGWGITFDPKEQLFYVSDGSDTIHVWNLDFEEIRSFRVSILLLNQDRNQNPYLSLINELEWDPNDGSILANVWFQNAIVRIHPRTGQVLQVFDLSSLYTDRTSDADVMNGIAHYKDNQWWVTGKYWPFLYLVELLG